MSVLMARDAIGERLLPPIGRGLFENLGAKAVESPGRKVLALCEDRLGATQCYLGWGLTPKARMAR